MEKNNRRSSRQASIKMAFCGLMTALSVTVMLAGGLIPIATYCVPLIAGLFLLPVLLEFGPKTAWTMFAATSLVCLLTGIDKEAAFFYVFLGSYPIVKWNLDKVFKKQIIRVMVKLLLFTVSITVMYVLMGLLLNVTAVIAEFQEMGTVLTIIFVIFFDLCMLMYDRLLLPLVILYAKRLRPRLRFLR